MALCDAESKLLQIYRGDNNVTKLLNMQKKIETYEEAMDFIVHMSKALAAVFSDKRKLESEIDDFKIRISEIQKEKEDLNTQLL